MSSPCRTTSLLVSKESDGRITYKSREKEDSLSLKCENNLRHLLFLSSSPRFLFLYSFLFAFLSFSLFSFLIFLSFSPHFIFSFCLFSLPFWSHHSSGQGRKLPPHFLKSKVWPSFFHLYSLISLFPFYDIINHMAQYGPWDSFSHTWPIVSHYFKWTTWLCQVSLS